MGAGNGGVDVEIQDQEPGPGLSIKLDTMILYLVLSIKRRPFDINRYNRILNKSGMSIKYCYISSYSVCDQTAIPLNMSLRCTSGTTILIGYNLVFSSSL